MGFGGRLSKTRFGLRDVVLLGVVVLLAAERGLPAIRAFAQGEPPTTAAVGDPQTGFIYQGRLTADGLPANGNVDLTFRLWDADIAGNLLATAGPYTNVPVANGLFAQAVDFGDPGNDGLPKWIEVLVKSSGSGDPAISLGRLPFTTAPHDHLFQDWSGASNAAALALRNTGLGDGLFAESASGAAVLGQSNNINSATIRGINNAQGGVAIQGDAFDGNGVVGTSSENGYAAIAGVHGGDCPQFNSECIGIIATALTGTYGVGLVAQGSLLGLRATGAHNGVVAESETGTAVTAISDDGHGVYGYTLSPSSSGVVGYSNVQPGDASQCDGLTFLAPFDACAGVKGVSAVSNIGAIGVLGEGQAGTGVAGYGRYGVFGQSNSLGFAGVMGRGHSHATCSQSSPSVLCYGVIGDAQSNIHGGGIGVMGIGSYVGVWGRAQGSSFAGYFDGKVHVVGNLTVTGTINGTVVGPSDARLKKDIADLAPGLDAVLALRPVTFGWLDPARSDRTQMGFIAQEVREVLPGIVHEGDDDAGTLAIEPLALLPVLVNAIQEQQAQIDALSAGTASNPGSPGTSWFALAGVAIAAAMVAGSLSGFVVSRRLTAVAGLTTARSVS